MVGGICFQLAVSVIQNVYIFVDASSFSVPHQVWLKTVVTFPPCSPFLGLKNAKLFQFLLVREALYFSDHPINQSLQLKITFMILPRAKYNVPLEVLSEL